MSFLNSGGDISWEWRDEQTQWRFPNVLLTAQTPIGALALHMLHQHGLAPLIASRSEQEFNETFAEDLERCQGEDCATNARKLELFVQSQEEFGPVKELRSLLESLTLNGLRNLHSFDHMWSVTKGQGVIRGCGNRTAHNCVLQAAMSNSTNKFLRDHGFTRLACAEALDAEQKLMRVVYSGSPEKSRTLRGVWAKEWLHPANAGEKTVHAEPTDAIETTSTGESYLSMVVKWESGRETRAKLPVFANNLTQLQAVQSNRTAFSKLAQELLDAVLEESTREHKAFMLENRLKLWAAEEASFAEMHDQLRNLVPPPSPPPAKKDSPPGFWSRILSTLGLST